jgi:hypothetical protein
VTEPRSAGLLPVADAVADEMPWLWWAKAGRARLAGMSAPPDGFPFSILWDQGLDTIVSLIGLTSYDPSPLSCYAFSLQDRPSAVGYAIDHDRRGRWRSRQQTARPARPPGSPLSRGGGSTHQDRAFQLHFRELLTQLT